MSKSASHKISAGLRDVLAVARDAAGPAAMHGHVGDDRYTVRPLPAEDGGGFLIEFPDLPGCISDGETVAEAIANGMDARAAWLAAMREAGRR